MFNLLKLLKVKFEGEGLTLKDGTPITINGNLEAGVQVNFLTTNGTEKPLPQGTYTLSTGEQIDVDDKGIITNITATAINNPSPDNPSNPTQSTDTVQSGLPNSSDALKAEKQEFKAADPTATTDSTPTPDTTPTTDTTTNSTPSIEDLTKRVDELEKTVKAIQESLATTNTNMLASKEEIEKIKTKATFAKEIINIPSSDTNENNILNETTSNVADIINTYFKNK